MIIKIWKRFLYLEKLRDRFLYFFYFQQQTHCYLLEHPKRLDRSNVKLKFLRHLKLSRTIFYLKTQRASPRDSFSCRKYNSLSDYFSNFFQVVRKCPSEDQEKDWGRTFFGSPKVIWYRYAHFRVTYRRFDKGAPSVVQGLWKSVIYSMTPFSIWNKKGLRVSKTSK